MKKELIFKSIVGALASIGVIMSIKEVIYHAKLHKQKQELSDDREVEAFTKILELRNTIRDTQKQRVYKRLDGFTQSNEDLEEIIGNMKYDLTSIESEFNHPATKFNDPLDMAYKYTLQIADLLELENGRFNVYFDTEELAELSVEELDNKVAAIMKSL